jgi:thymidylate synthase
MSVTHLLCRNANDGFLAAMYHLRNEGVVSESRNGSVLMSPGPVIVEMTNPLERVVWFRRINPFLHFMEAMWMLAGRNDVDFVAEYTPRMRNYSDDGKTLHGAYGRRWFTHFTIDQVWECIKRLRKDPADRRAVISMWDPRTDVNSGPYSERKDVPCNTQILLAIRKQALDMTVINRSNDIVWGAFGTNSVHFTFLQELIACGIGVPVGRYFVMSNNFHMYDSVEGVERFRRMGAIEDKYKTETNVRIKTLGLSQPSVLFFLADLKRVLDDIIFPSEFTFINNVVKPVMHSWHNRKCAPALYGTDWGLSIQNYFRRKE